MITLDEEINNEKEVIKRLARSGVERKRMNYHKRILEWLEELKRYRKDYAWAENRAYNKALSDLVCFIKDNLHYKQLYIEEIEMAIEYLREDINK